MIPPPAGVPAEVPQRAAIFNPLHHAVALLRGAWFGEPWGTLAGSAAVMAGLLVVATATAAARFRWV